MIERIIIENYKSIRQIDFRLSPINILIGANGAGKSNFISFFELAKQVYQDEIGEYTMDHGGAGTLLHGGIKVSEYISGLLDFENTNAYKFELTPTRNFQSLRIAESGDYYNDDPQRRKDKDYNKWHWKASNNPWRDNREKYLAAYLDSFRVYHFHDTSRTSAMKNTGPLNNNRYLEEDAGNMAALLYLLQQKHPTHFRRIEMTIRSIAPFFDRFRLAPSQLDTNQINLEWKERGSDLYMDAYSLSDGSLRFMALTTLLMQPHPPKTIIIDEPELGLHPMAINKLAGLMKKASIHSQLIVSTQSVGLVSNFEPEDIITVDRKDGQSVFERLDNETLQNWLEDFSLGELWNKNVIGGQP
jgi:predicted ATPase